MTRHIESNEQRESRGLRQGNEIQGPVLEATGAVIARAWFRDPTGNTLGLCQG